MHILSSLCVSGKCKFAKFVLVLKGYTSVPGKVIHPFHALTSCEKQNDRHFVLNGNADGMNNIFTRQDSAGECNWFAFVKMCTQF